MSFNFLKISCKFLVNEKERWNGLLFTARAIVHDAHHVSYFQFYWNQGGQESVKRERKKEWRLFSAATVHNCNQVFSLLQSFSLLHTVHN